VRRFTDDDPYSVWPITWVCITAGKFDEAISASEYAILIDSAITTPTDFWPESERYRAAIRLFELSHPEGVPRRGAVQHRRMPRKSWPSSGPALLPAIDPMPPCKKPGLVSRS
jgi:hypothetical protein